MVKNFTAEQDMRLGQVKRKKGNGRCGVNRASQFLALRSVAGKLLIGVAQHVTAGGMCACKKPTYIIIFCWHTLIRYRDPAIRYSANRNIDKAPIIRC